MAILTYANATAVSVDNATAARGVRVYGVDHHEDADVSSASLG